MRGANRARRELDPVQRAERADLNTNPSPLEGPVAVDRGPDFKGPDGHCQSCVDAGVGAEFGAKLNTEKGGVLIDAVSR